MKVVHFIIVGVVCVIQVKLLRGAHELCGLLRSTIGYHGEIIFRVRRSHLRRGSVVREALNLKGRHIKMGQLRNGRRKLSIVKVLIPWGKNRRIQVEATALTFIRSYLLLRLTAG
jgi:hypothetical protein